MKKQICLAQTGISNNIREHIQKIKRIILENRKADLIVFPELILHGHPSIEKPEGFLYRKIKQFYQFVADLSDDLYVYVRELDARVIIGELQGGPERFHNAATYIDKDHIESYAKTHVHWTENFIPGDKLKVFSSPSMKIGITICFDAAFSEVWRVLTLKGAKIVINISATPKEFSHDYVLRRLQGAAISNQIFIVYVNRPDKIFSGHSSVINPRGDVIFDAGEKEHVSICTIDLEEVDTWRHEEEIFPNRRAKLYRNIITQRIPRKEIL